MKNKEIKNRYIKFILADTRINRSFRLKIKKKLKKNILFPQRYCVLTKRTRSVFKKFKLSRIVLRELALNGEIPGLIKKN